MKYLDRKLIFSPSDLVNYFKSPFITWMDRFVLEKPGSATRDQPGEEDELVFRKGIEHEREFLIHLKSQKQDVVDLTGSESDPRPTLQAMRAGARVIYQGYLRRDNFAGLPDFLVRVDAPSELGAWSYEVWDTKLSKHPRPYFLIQLCCYAEMLQIVQGFRPAQVRVVLGKRAGASKEIASFRTDDYFYYYLSLKEAFLRQQAEFNPAQPPEIPPMADLSHWTDWAAAELESRDDLSLVANIRRSQIRKLRDGGIQTVAQLAAAKARGIPELNRETLEKLRRQASLQVRSRGLDRPLYELIQPRADLGHRGLAALPPASPGDIFFDMEGFPLIDEGREYLFGAGYYHKGNLQYRDWWAHSEAEERLAFQGFVAWAYERWKKHPAMHIYHYNHYETDALKRLMSKFGECEDEIDRLLYAEVFVDLFPIVRQSMMVGEPGYSLKNIEKLYRRDRQGDVASAGESMVFYQRWLIAQDGDTPETSPILRHIRDYNCEDCASTAQLAAWLRGLQQQYNIAWQETAPSPPRAEKTSGRSALAESIIARQTEPGEPSRVATLLAWLLEFHRRAEKPIWWARFHRRELDVEELAADPECLAGLALKNQLAPGLNGRRRWKYQFDPRQETKLREGDSTIFIQDFDQRALLEQVDFDKGFAVLSFTPELAAPPELLNLGPDELMTARLLAPAVERVVRAWDDTGELPPALECFLYRKPPRLRGRKPGSSILAPAATPLQGSVEAGAKMDATSLCVQGPPGTGKTYTAARMIASLLQAGKRVGITSNSHRAINLLLCETCRAARDASVNFKAVKVGQGQRDCDGLPPDFPQAASGSTLFKKRVLPDLIGGTVFAFSAKDAAGKLDYLFIDEAGQVSTANLAAMSPAARNIVLVGDQMQLAQPVQGVHPGESGLSTLDYLLLDHPTVPPAFGIFLPDTYRLHPSLCGFISGAIYEGRLTPVSGNELRVLEPGSRLPSWLHRTAGLEYVPVDHADNSTESPEEEERIVSLIDDLLKMRLRQKDGSSRPLSRDDILIVTPFNLQVRRLEKRLHPVRVGTVDKFQGQQAPVVIVSLCASVGDASPRGIDFLFSINRLNVAISRAQTLAILVACPKLLRTTCSTVEQMRLVNLFCRAVHAARPAAVRRAT